MHVHNTQAEPWTVTVADTGYNAMTAGCVKRVQTHIGNERFMLTYGDGVADVDLAALLARHECTGAEAA